jgi:hypothetical protein
MPVGPAVGLTGGPNCWFSASYRSGNRSAFHSSIPGEVASPYLRASSHTSEVLALVKEELAPALTMHPCARESSRLEIAQRPP